MDEEEKLRQNSEEELNAKEEREQKFKQWAVTATKCALELVCHKFKFQPAISPVDFDFASLVLKLKVGISSKKFI